MTTFALAPAGQNFDLSSYFPHRQHRKMQSNGDAAVNGIDQLEVDQINDQECSVLSPLVRIDTNDTVSDDDTEMSLGGCPAFPTSNLGTLRTAGWIYHTTSSNKKPNHTPSTSSNLITKTVSKKTKGRSSRQLLLRPPRRRLQSLRQTWLESWGY